MPTDSPGEDMAKLLLLYRRIGAGESNWWTKVRLNPASFRRQLERI